MIKDSSQIEDVIARGIGEGSDHATRAIQHRRLLEEAGRLARRASIGKRRRWRLIAAAAAIVALATVTALVAWSPEDLACWNDGESLAEGAWLHADPDKPIELVFSDKSELRLEANARARLAAMSAHAVELALESGVVNAEIRAGQKRTWSVTAGPYRVTVVGTCFRVEWRPTDQRIDVVVQQGVVEVTGGDLLDRIALVHSGETLEITTGRIELVKNDLARPAAAHPAALELDTVAEGGSAAAPLMAVDGHDASRPESPAQLDGARHRDKHDHASDSADWERLAREHRFPEAMAAAEAAGFDELVASLDGASLLRLADVARLARRYDLADQSFAALRRRFPGSVESTSAAFRLARLQYDRKRYRQAIRWLRTYITEAPKGDFAPNARGRLIEALLKANDQNGARMAAAEYLRLHPQGAYRELAERTLLGEKR